MKIRSTFQIENRQLIHFLPECQTEELSIHECTFSQIELNMLGSLKTIGKLKIAQFRPELN